jgi:hypothetical protein
MARTKKIFLLLALAGLPMTSLLHAQDTSGSGYTLDQQLPHILGFVQYTGNLGMLGNKVPITVPGRVYKVRQSNILLAAYSLPQTLGDMSQQAAAVGIGTGLQSPDIAIFQSPACNVPMMVALPFKANSSPSPAPVSPECRRDLAMGKARFLQAGEEVELAGFDGSFAQDQMRFTILEHYRGPNNQETPRFQTQVLFQFPSRSLMAASAQQIANTIYTYLTPESEPSANTAFPPAPLPEYSLTDQLSALYNPRKYVLGSDKVYDEDKVLKVKQDKLLTYTPVSDMYGCTAVIEDGKPLPPGGSCKAKGFFSALVTATTAIQAVNSNDAQGLLNARPTKGFFQAGQELEVESITTQSKKKNDILEIKLIDYTVDEKTGMHDDASFHTNIQFQFSKGYLATASAKDVAKAVEQAFDVETIPPPAAHESATEIAALSPSANSVPLPAVAAPPQTLEEQMKSLFKLTVLDASSAMTTRGIVLNVTQDKILLGTPAAKPITCPATVADGHAKAPTVTCQTPLKTAIARGDAKFFATGQKLDLVSVTVNLAKETVTLGLVDDVATPGSKAQLRASVNFVFAKGYLEGSDAGQIAETVSILLAPQLEPAGTQ